MSLVAGIPFLAEHSAGVEVQGVKKPSTLEVVSLKECEDILALFEMSQESKLKVFDISSP